MVAGIQISYILSRCAVVEVQCRWPGLPPQSINIVFLLQHTWTECNQYIHTYVPTIHTYVHKYMYVHTDDTHICMYLQYIHVRTYIHTYVHTYRTCLNRSPGLYFLLGGFDPASIRAWPLFEPSFYFSSTGNNNRKMAADRPLCTFEKESTIRELREMLSPHPASIWAWFLFGQIRYTHMYVPTIHTCTYIHTYTHTYVRTYLCTYNT